MQEMLDIYNEKLEKIGVKPRSEVHKYGFKHKVVQCFIVNSKEKIIYFQQRAFDKDTCPGMYDIACAGHVDKNEDFMYSMKRELVEETGIKIKEGDNKLEYVGTNFEKFQDNTCIDDEICELFIFYINSDNIIEIKEELIDMVKVQINMYEKWVNGDIKILFAKSLKDNKEVTLTKENSCPHIIKLCEKLKKQIFN